MYYLHDDKYVKHNKNESVEQAIDSCVKVFDSVDKMNSASGTLKDGQVVKTKGYYVKNDGGGTEYIKNGDDFNVLEKYEGYIDVEKYGIVGYSSEEEAKRNIYEASKIQELLDKRLSLQFKGKYYAFTSHFKMNAQSIKGVGKFKTTLVFPNSRGLVWDKASYVFGMELSNLTIKAKYECIDFKNKGGEHRPHNIYQNIIENLYLVSENEGCVYAGDNKGEGSDQLVFEQTFKNITVNAKKYGFYGIGGLGIRFEQINDNTNMKYVFQNCHGKFVNINTTFCEADYFIYMDNDMPDNYGVVVDLDNTNMEGFKKGAIYCENPRVLFSLLRMVNSVLTIDGKVRNNTTYPFYIPEVINLVLVGPNGVSNYRSPIYDLSQVKCLYHLWNGEAKTRVQGTQTVKMMIKEQRDPVSFNWRYTDNLENSPLESKMFISKFIKEEEVHANLLTGGRYRKTILIEDGREKPDQEGNIYDMLLYKITSPLRLGNIQVNKETGNNMVIVKNHPESTSNITISQDFIYFIGGDYKVLKPGEQVLLMWNGKKWNEVEMGHITYTTTSDIPQKIKDPYKGYITFDATKNKIIVWDGSRWLEFGQS